MRPGTASSSYGKRLQTEAERATIELKARRGELVDRALSVAREKSELLPREEVDRRVAEIEEAPDPETRQRLIASTLV